MTRDEMIAQKEMNLKVNLPEPIIGYWVLPGSGISMTMFSAWSRPNWFHRKMMLWMLGWKWKESNGS